MTDLRKPVFDALRNAKGTLTQSEVAQIDECLDRLGIARSSVAVDAFSAALKVILRHEGGFVNHPKDPGGMTNLGVTKGVWEKWIGRAATEAEMRALTPEKVAPVYRRYYWDVLRCDELHPALALCVFDFGVNAGTSRAARYLQQMLTVTADGAIGPATIAAARAYVTLHGADEAVQRYSEARRSYYRQLSTFPTFGKGWLRRVSETEAEALRLA